MWLLISSIHGPRHTLRKNGNETMRTRDLHVTSVPKMKATHECRQAIHLWVRLPGGDTSSEAGIIRRLLREDLPKAFQLSSRQQQHENPHHHPWARSVASPSHHILFSCVCFHDNKTHTDFPLSCLCVSLFLAQQQDDPLFAHCNTPAVTMMYWWSASITLPPPSSAVTVAPWRWWSCWWPVPPLARRGPRPG